MDRFLKMAAVAALAIPFLLAPLAARATTPTLSVSFQGSFSGCADTTLNGPQNFSFTTSGASSGADTIISVNLGSAGSFSVPVPTADVEAIAAAATAAGGTITVPIMESLEPPENCFIDGTLSISVVGGAAGSLDAQAPPNVGTRDTVLRTETTALSNTLAGRVLAALDRRKGGVNVQSGSITVTGTAAGEGNRPPVGAWASYSFTDSEDTFASTAFTSDRHGVLMGLDVMPGDNWLLGVAFGLDRTDVKTRFNGGEQGITSITLAPYVGVLFSDWLSMDASLGISDVQIDQFRTAAGARVTSDVESIRVFGNLNLTASRAFGALLATGRAGVLYASQKDEDFVESNGTAIPDSRSNLGRFLLGGELAYSAGAWEPYVGGLFQHDFTKTTVTFAPGTAQPRSDDSDFLLSLGLRYFGKDNLSGSVEYSRLVGRRNLDEDTINASVRWQF